MNLKNTTELQPFEALERTPQIILIILYSTTAIVSFVSNSTVIFILGFGKKSSNELKKFLINLAIAVIIIIKLLFMKKIFLYMKRLLNSQSLKL